MSMPRLEFTPSVPPVTVINEFVSAAAPSPPESRHDLGPQTPSAKVEETRARPAPSPDPVRSAKLEKPPARAPDELAYVSPAERVFEALHLPRPAPTRDIAEAIPAAPDVVPTPPVPRPARDIPAREMRETIREIVRETVSTAPPRDVQRMPKTAAEASVIGPLGSPYAAARRLALMLR